MTVNPNEIDQTPRVVGFTPKKGNSKRDIDMTIVGTNFRRGVDPDYPNPTVEFLNYDVSEYDYFDNDPAVRVSETELRLHVRILEYACISEWAIKVTNPGGQSGYAPYSFMIDADGRYCRLPESGREEKTKQQAAKKKKPARKPKPAS